MNQSPSSEINYANVAGALLTNLPELMSRYERLLADSGGEVPGPHVVYGDVLNRYIDELLQSNDGDALRVVFMFVERLADSGDVRVREVVGATVCWYFGGYPEKLAQIRLHMGPSTKQISDEIERYYGRGT